MQARLEPGCCGGSLAPKCPERGAPPRRAPPCATESGFTLVELVIVLIVLAVAGSLAIPALRPALESVRMEAAVRRTASDLDKVRQRAVLERKVFVVRCNTHDNQLGLVGDKPFPIPEQVALVECSEEELRYYPQGSATGLTLLLRDQRGRERRVKVGAFTGLARVDAPP